MHFRSLTEVWAGGRRRPQTLPISFGRCARPGKTAALGIFLQVGMVIFLAAGHPRLSIERSPGPSMPSRYQQESSAAELEDIVSYLMHQPSSPVMQDTQSRRRKEAQLE
jgi:hypothetical protein